MGKCEKECATVTLEEHTKCGCGCQIDRGQCETDGLHRFKRIFNIIFKLHLEISKVQE